MGEEVIVVKEGFKDSDMPSMALLSDRKEVNTQRRAAMIQRALQKKRSNFKDAAATGNPRHFAKEDMNEASKKQKAKAFNVHLRGKHIDTVWFTGYTADEARKSLINHDGYHPNIVVKESVNEAVELPPIHQIARGIKKNWKKPYFGAVPYIEAMQSLHSVHDTYGMDSGHSVVAYGLSNMNSYSGKSTHDPVLAKTHRALLKAHLKAPKKVNEAKKTGVFNYHRKKIALATLKMSDVGARIMGGPTKAEAREYLRSLRKVRKESIDEAKKDTEDKVKKTVEKAINLARNKKSKGKTANTEPKLAIPDTNASTPTLMHDDTEGNKNA